MTRVVLKKMADASSRRLNQLSFPSVTICHMPLTTVFDLCGLSSQQQRVVMVTLRRYNYGLPDTYLTSVS